MELPAVVPSVVCISLYIYTEWGITKQYKILFDFLVEHNVIVLASVELYNQILQFQTAQLTILVLHMLHI